MPNSDYIATTMPLPGLETRTGAVSELLQSLHYWHGYNFENAVAYGAGLTEFLMGRNSRLPINIMVSHANFPTVQKLMTPDMRASRLAKGMMKAIKGHEQWNKKSNPDFTSVFTSVSAIWTGRRAYMHLYNLMASMSAPPTDNPEAKPSDIPVPIRIVGHDNQYHPHFSAIGRLKYQSAIIDQIAIQRDSGVTITTYHKDWRADAEKQIFRMAKNGWHAGDKAFLHEYFRQRAEGREITPDLEVSPGAAIKEIHDAALAEATAMAKNAVQQYPFGDADDRLLRHKVITGAREFLEKIDTNLKPGHGGADYCNI